MRRHGLTTIFGNPGSTEIPFLTDLPSDIRFVLGLHEGSVVGMATRLRARARGAGVRQPAHRRRPGQRGQRDRQRARLPRAARDRRRPAGPPADRARAVPDRPRARAAGRRVSGVAPASGPRPRTCPARSPAPTTRRRPRAVRRWSWSRWATGSSRPTSWPPARPRGSCARTSVAADQVRRARRASGGRRVAGARGRSARRGRLGRRHRAGRAARLPGVAGAVQPARRLPPGSPAVRGPPDLAAPADARHAVAL